MLSDVIDQLKLETYNFLSHSVSDRENVICGLDLKNIRNLDILKEQTQDLVPFITCGRIEFIYLSDRFINIEGFDKKFGIEAIEHLVSVVSGLNSLIIGETQVVNQFKKSFYDAVSSGLATTRILCVFSEVMKIAKRVRSETNIPSISFSSVIKSKIQEVFNDTENRTLFIIGTGEIAHDVFRLSRFFKKTLVYSRKKEKAEMSVKKIQDFFGAKAEFICSIDEGIKLSDIAIVATNHHGFLIKNQHIKEVNKKTLIIDLSVPRNVSPDILNNPNIILYNIDIIGENKLDPNTIELAKKTMKSEIDKLKLKLDMDRKVKEIACIRADFERIISEHVRRYLNLIDEGEIYAFSKSLSNRLLGRFFQEKKSCDLTEQQLSNKKQ